MATSLFPTNTASTATLPVAFTGTKKLLSLTRGAGVVSQTDNTLASLGGLAGNAHSWGGTVAAVAPKNGLVWVTNPLTPVTLASINLVTTNVRALENNAMANYGLAVWIYWITADGSTATLIYSRANSLELGVTEAAWNESIAGLASDRALAANDRLALVLGYVSVGGSASGFTATGFYAGAAGATGDTFVSFVETITEQGVAVKPRKPVYKNQVPVMRAVLR